MREDGLANWPPSAGAELEQDGEIRLQWCHGAPGDRVDARRRARRGAPSRRRRADLARRPARRREGAGLCHGTAGNGFALLAAFDRTRDELWLERARRFAVHALAQARRLPPRYSLFTGGVGAALFAARCIDALAEFPTIDSWD